jgi:hypothetical protein
VKNFVVLGIVAGVALGVTGCATSSQGNAPGAESGNARNEMAPKDNAPLQSEMLMPGVGSALFPDPAF